MDRTPFRFYPKCHSKYPYTDQHRVCNQCLSPEHREDTCEACRAFRSKKTLRDRRARRLQMASTPKGQLDVGEEESISIQWTDSDESESDRTSTVQRTVSKPAPSKTHTKIFKAMGTPPPTGHGLTHRKEGAARKRANSQSSGDAPPPDKESRKFDAAGKRVAAQAANQWRIANSQALLARYDRAHWDEMQHIIQHLPKEHQKRAQQDVEEGQAISNNQIRSALDSADTAAQTVNTAVTIRRHAWLRSSGFKPEIQQAVLNMPFNQEQLFGPEVDTAIEKLKKDTDTAKAMGALYSPQVRGTFRKPQFRGGF
ncbi:hypothetical protein NDU88_000862 [Pleurodeles waltl]|uniref:Lamina-associated polypeptide 2 alpha C-terminal domain-containing protein n=1 Tax=Pleurodeles waltl TaxID=8319 RepID=A0AAV7NCJ6_PLEWA|nr:hypothetical protein NDU88_000862 [Pleurodeles waltl]